MPHSKVKPNIFFDNKFLFITSFLSLFVLFIVDKLFLKLFKYEGAPEFSWEYVANSLFIISSVVVLFKSLYKKKAFFKFHNNSFEISLTWLTLIGSTIFLLLFYFDPVTFNSLSKEDGIVEWLSAILMFFSCFGTLFLFFKSKKIFIENKLLPYAFLGFTLVFFVLGMEEVSWFQRVFEIETPDAFEGNVQDEMNLHNFATNTLELIYYVGSFLFLVGGALARVLYPHLLKNPYFRIFLPMPIVAIVGAIASAYNYDMWNMVFIQFAFYASIGILFLFYKYSNIKSQKTIILYTILLVTISQALFLTFGEHFDRLWEITEYKEFLISVGWLVYVVSLGGSLEGSKASIEKIN